MRWKLADFGLAGLFVGETVERVQRWWRGDCGVHPACEGALVMKISDNELVLWVSEAAIAGTTIVLVALVAACAVLSLG